MPGSRRPDASAGGVCSEAKRFGETVAVNCISLKITAGAYCCLLGPSGCGKTTILRLIAGHETPTSGEVRIDAEDIVGLPPRRRGTAMMFQDYALFPHLTCLDNVAFSLKMSRVSRAERRERAREMLAKVQMAPFADPVIAGDAVRAHWTASDVHLLISSVGRRDRPYASEQN